jgi:hypothetical protein
MGVGAAVGPAQNTRAGLNEPLPGSWMRSRVLAMTRDELIVQLIKIALAAAIGIYFIWWSLEVLHRLPAQ